MKKDTKTVDSVELIFSASGIHREHSGPTRDWRGVSVQIGLLPHRTDSTAPSKTYIATANVSDTVSILAVLLPDKSLVEFKCEPGDFCIFAPCSVITNLSESPSDLIQYRIPRLAVQSASSQRNNQDIDALITPFSGADMTMALLSRAARSLISTRDGCSDAIAEYFAMSLYSHLLDRYGIRSVDPDRFVGGLSPQHKRIIQECLSPPFGPAITIENVATQCGLSVGHFARAFRQTFGTSFHKRLLQARVNEAKIYLTRTDISLREVAFGVGYADQTSFTESFTRVVGIPPGRYRRRFLAATGKDTSAELRKLEVKESRSPGSLGT